MKNKRKKQLFITIAIILILIAVFCLIHFLNRTKMNSGYVNGNSAGNLYNDFSVKATALFSSVILPTTTDSIP